MQLGRAILWRVMVALVATGVWWWLGVHWGGIEVRPQDPAGKFAALLWFMVTGVIWWLTLGLPAVLRLGESAGGLFWPAADNSEWRPEFSIAEARAKQGRYTEAIAEYRKAAEQFPQEITPHLRVAELLLEKCGDPEGAIAELETATARATSDDAFAMLRHRLADLYVQHRDDRAAARRLMEEIQQQFPNTKHARSAADRLTRLQ